MQNARALVLGAPPGAGKTTRVPRALLDSGFPGEIVVLEPRRLAARLAARRVAEELGERLGETVGFTVRFEDTSSARTRIRFVTEGVLTRRLLSNPELRGVGAVLLDEFHERHLQGDLALALLARLRRTSRPDLALCVMSATLDGAPLATFLGAPVVQAEGRRFPVETEHLPAPDERRLELQVVSAVRRLVTEGPRGDLLIFLPGAAEIRRAREACERLASEAGMDLATLHGDLPPQEQDRAVRPGPRPKIILSTNVAESSVTIEGVVAVVDAGLQRSASHSAWSGLPSLRVTKVSQASAAQREGRAGRTAPGRCLRLYTRADLEARPEHEVPEILRSDLADTILQLRGAGLRSVDWLDAPPAPAVAAAETLLSRLGAIDGAGAITALGRRRLAFPVHPRQARLIVAGEDLGVAEDACAVAALLGERDVRARERARFGDATAGGDEPTQGSDLIALLDRLREAEASSFAPHALRAIGLDPGATFALDQARRQLARRAKNRVPSPTKIEATDEAIGRAVLLAFPDRVARRKKKGSRELAFAQGTIAELEEASVVRDAPFLVGAAADESRGVVVRLASAVDPGWLLDAFVERIEETRELRWNSSAERVEAVTRLLYDGLAVDETLQTSPRGPDVARRLAEAAIERGLREFAPEGALDRFLARARFVETRGGPVKVPDEGELRELALELAEGASSFAELRDAGLLHRVAARTSGAARLAELAPEKIVLASGFRAELHYEEGKPPWLESFIQDFFGMKLGPRLMGVDVVLHLCAPNRRAVQVTRDLPGFWERHYPALRRELARKYPRHAWPEDPSVAVPTRRQRGP